jgi:hypothetical protein
MNRYLRTLLPPLAFLVLAACSQGDSSGDPPTLKTAPPVEGPDASDNVTDRMAIRVYLPSTKTYEDWTGNTLRTKVDELCRLRHYCEIIGTAQTCVDRVTRTSCDLATDLCVAETLNEIAEAAVVPVELKHTRANWRYTVPPQSEPARLEILKQVILAAQRLTAKALGASAEGPSEHRYPGVCAGDNHYYLEYVQPEGADVDTDNTKFKVWPDTAESPSSDKRGLIDVLAAAYTTGERLTRAATFAAVEKMVQVAEWDRGAALSFPVAQKAVFSRAGLSRAAAAHLLVGGDEGLRIATEPNSSGEIPAVDAFCMSELSEPGARRAVAAIRSAGVPGAMLRDPSVSLGQLVDGVIPAYQGAASAGGSIRERLAAKRGEPMESAYTELNLSEADFAQARNYLAEEYLAFGRSDVPLEQLPGTELWRYSGTASEPPQRTAAYFSTVARTDKRGYVVGPEAGFDWNFSMEIPSQVMSFTSYHFALVRSLRIHLSNPGHLGYAPAAGYVAARPIYMLAARLEAESSALIAYAHKPGAPTPELQISSRDPGRLSLVAGEQNNDCALTGTAEGATCQFSEVEVVGSLQPDPQLSGTAARLKLPREKKRLYVHLVADDGSRKLIAGIPYIPPTATHGVELQFSVLPEVEAKVADLLRPSSRACSRAAVDCNGELYDAALPLENELNDDGNGVENSWRYYLDRAEAAARDADALGEAYLSAQITSERDSMEAERFNLTVRERVDQELETVQRICGVSTDSDSLLRIFGQDGKLETVVEGTCGTDAECDADDSKPNDEQCIANQCVKVPEKFIEFQDEKTINVRLRECLGISKTVKYAALGDRALCVLEGPTPCGSSSSCPAVVPDSPQAKLPYGAYLAYVNNYCAQRTPFAGRRWIPVVDQLKYAHVVPEQPYVVPVSDLRRPSRVVETNLDTAPVIYATIDPEPLRSFFDISGRIWDNVERTLRAVPLTPASRPRGASIAFSPTGVALPLDQIGGIMREYAVEPPTADKFGCPVGDEFALIRHNALCHARRFENALGKRLLAGFPKSALSALTRQGATGSFPAAGGEYGVTLSGFRARLIAYQDNQRIIADELRGLAADMADYELHLDAVGVETQKQDLTQEQIELNVMIKDLEIDIARRETKKQRWRAAIGTVAAVASTTMAVVSGNVGGAVSGAGELFDIGDTMLSTIPNKRERIAQTEKAILELQKKGVNLNRQLLQIESARKLLETEETMARRASAIAGAITNAWKEAELLDAELAQLELLRDEARRALHRAVGAASPQLKVSEAKLVRLSSNTAALERDRYEEAFGNARRMAFLAKRAIEQRLGVRFAEMKDKLPLVDAPADWENEICVAQGLNYDALQSEQGLPTGNLNGFLGRYVDKLKNVVDAYQLKYAFQSGQDLMTVSLKEDVFRTVNTCDRPSVNLLQESQGVGRAYAATAATLTRPDPTETLHEVKSAVWTAAGCGASPCVWVGNREQRPDDSLPLSDARSISVYGTTGRLAQSVVLQPGEYLLSWYETGRRTGATMNIRAAGASTVLTPVSETSAVSHTLSGTTWTRYVRRYSVVTSGTYAVEIQPSARASTEYGTIVVAAPMLELISPDAVTATASPFENRDDEGQAQYECADREGSVFRNDYWTQGCVRLCPQSSNGDCPDASATPRCYHEATFELTQRGIERGTVLRNSGFAYGNYNYRIESVAANVVGQVRDCDGGGAACYSIGYVPVSIYHRGPFTVRNHTGADQIVNLFNGRIESAKGLALERYLTNPLSSSDEQLLTPYLRSEFQGRPLDGNFVIRLWDDEGFDFEKVQDVQLLVKYRYWTAAE